jgi:hypothetical protein
MENNSISGFVPSWQNQKENLRRSAIFSALFCGKRLGSSFWRSRIASIYFLTTIGKRKKISVHLWQIVDQVLLLEKQDNKSFFFYHTSHIEAHSLFVKDLSLCVFYVSIAVQGFRFPDCGK